MVLYHLPFLANHYCCQLFNFILFPDSQMVPYLLRLTQLGGIPPRIPHHPTSSPSQNPSCRSARNVFLHHDRLAELAFGETQILECLRNNHRKPARLQTESGRYEMGPERNVIQFLTLAFCCFSKSVHKKNDTNSRLKK